MNQEQWRMKRQAWDTIPLESGNHDRGANQRGDCAVTRNSAVTTVSSPSGLESANQGQCEPDLFAAGGLRHK